MSIALTIMAGLLMLAGGIMNLVGGMRLMVAAKRSGMGWFFACSFSPGFVLYCLAYFSVVRRPLLLWLAGLLMFGVGKFIFDLMGQ